MSGCGVGSGGAWRMGRCGLVVFVVAGAAAGRVVGCAGGVGMLMVVVGGGRLMVGVTAVVAAGVAVLAVAAAAEVAARLALHSRKVEGRVEDDEERADGAGLADGAGGSSCFTSPSLCRLAGSGRSLLLLLLLALVLVLAAACISVSACESLPLTVAGRSVLRWYCRLICAVIERACWSRCRRLTSSSSCSSTPLCAALAAASTMKSGMGRRSMLLAAKRRERKRMANGCW